jgi:hypothetical protein
MSDCVVNSLSVLPDKENIGIAVGISLLSCIQAEIYDIVYVLPVMAAIFDLPVTPIIQTCGLHSQSSTAVTHCLIVTAHFTDLGRMVARVKLANPILYIK